ncbi:FKBP-type peptidyl-prolyl cis-trans isomerase [Aquirufa sp. Wall-65K1]
MNRSTLYLIITLIFTLFTFASCNFNAIDQQVENNESDIQKYIKDNKLNAQKSPEGMYYSILSAGTSGKQANYTDLVKFHYVMTLLNGSKVDSTSRILKQPRAYVTGSFESIFSLPLRYMKEGDKGVFILPASLAFGGSSYGNGLIPAFSVIKIDIELISIQSETQVIDEMKKTYNVNNPEVTSSGLIFQKTISNPNGKALIPAQTYLVNYTGRLGFSYLKLDAAGKVVYDPIFDSRNGASMLVGAGQLIAGFDEGIMKLKMGEKAIVIIPSKLGYGANNQGSIPANSPLCFEIEVPVQ